MDLHVFLSFMKSQLLTKLPKPTGDLNGSTVIVTGANIGLGLEAARHFASFNPKKLILACRNTAAGEKAKESILATTKRIANGDFIEVWSLDLASYASVKAFAKRANALDRIDILLENAGMNRDFWSTAEDNEFTLTVNVVSTFLLALLVLPKMKETAGNHERRPTITIVSSEVHKFTSFPERRNVPDDGSLFDTLNDPSKANLADRYNVSKLLEVLTVRAICEQAAPASEYPVTINTVNPGFCESKLTRDITGARKYLVPISKFLLARTTEEGSRTLVSACLANDAKTHGQYLSDCSIGTPSKFVTSKEGMQWQRRVWEELARKLDAIEPQSTSNILN